MSYIPSYHSLHLAREFTMLDREGARVPSNRKVRIRYGRLTHSLSPCEPYLQFMRRSKDRAEVSLLPLSKSRSGQLSKSHVEKV